MVGATFLLVRIRIVLSALQFAINTFGDGRGSLWPMILENFVLDFAFAANVFLIFLALHLALWFASGLEAYAKTKTR